MSPIDWEYGAKLGTEVFEEGDSVVIVGDTEANITARIEDSFIQVNDNAHLSLKNLGGSIDNCSIRVAGVLSLLSRNVIGTGTQILGGRQATVVVNWGGEPGQGASLGDVMTNYEGTLRVVDSAYNIQTSEASKAAFQVYGESYVDFDGGVYAGTLGVVSVGNNTFNADTGVQIAGEVSGCGTITKTGAGIMTIDHTDLYFAGDIVVKEGGLCWLTTSRISSLKRIDVSTIIVDGEDATFYDSFLGSNIHWGTDFYLANGGKMESIDASEGRRPVWYGFPKDPVEDTDYLGCLMQNYYGSLTVEGTATMEMTLNNGGRRFTILTSKNPVPDPDEELPEDVPAPDEGGAAEGGELGGGEIADAAPDGGGAAEGGELGGGEIADADPAVGEEPGAEPDITPDPVHELQIVGAGAEVRQVFVEFDLVDDFNGTMVLGGENTAENVSVSLTDVNIAQGHTFSAGTDLNLINARSRGNLTKRGDGTLALSGALDVHDDLFVEGGALQVAGTLTARNATMSAGTTTTVQGVIETNTLTFKALEEGDTAGPILSTTGSALIKDWALLESGFLTVNGNILPSEIVGPGNEPMSRATAKIHLRGREIFDAEGGSVAAAQLNVTGDVTVSTLQMEGDTTVNVGADLTTGILSKDGDGMLSAAKVTVTRGICMNYDGSIYVGGDNMDAGAVRKLNLNDRVVLRYDSRLGAKLMKLEAANIGLDNVNHIYMDFTNCSVEELQNGISLGIENGSRLFFEPYLRFGNQLVNPVVSEGADGYLRLVADGKKETMWDTNWDLQERATIGHSAIEDESVAWSFYETIKAPNIDLPVREVKGFESGMIPSGTTSGQAAVFYRDNNYIALNAHGVKVNGLNNYLCGGFPINANAGMFIGEVKADIWLTVTGDFETVVGGSLSSGESSGALSGNTHLMVGDGARVGAIIGGHLQAGGEAEFRGNSYISVSCPNVVGPIVGRNVGSGDQYGDTHIFIYEVLGQNDRVTVFDTTMADNHDSVLWTTATGAVVGATFNCGVRLNMVGDTYVTIDLAESTSRGGAFQKIITGGGLTTPIFNALGNTLVRIQNTDVVSFNANISGGTIASNLTTQRTGNTSIVVQNSAAVFNSHITGVDFCSAISAGTSLSLTGDTSFAVGESENAQFSQRVVVGHDVFFGSGTNRGSVTQYIDGDTFFYADSGVFNNRVVAGNYFFDEDNILGNWNSVRLIFEDHYNFSSIITGTTHINVSGGTFNDILQGGSFASAQNYGGSYSDQHSAKPNNDGRSFVMHIGGIDMNITGGTFGKGAGSIAILGGLDATDTATPVEDPSNYMLTLLEGSIGDINITFNGEDVKVQGEIIGGSRIRAVDVAPAEPANIPYSGFVVYQGNITLNFHEGTFLGDVYAAGFIDPAGTWDRCTGGMSTAGVEVQVGSKAVFGEVRVSAGYKNTANLNHGDMSTSIVYGCKVLNFNDPEVYTNLNTGVVFTFFNQINVVENADVTIYQLLQDLCPGNFATKTGEGILRLASTSEPTASSSTLDMFNVKEGTLVLPMNSGIYRDGLVLETLSICGGATLDISEGYCGVRGTLVMAENSKLNVNLHQDPTEVGRLIWGDGGVKNAMAQETATNKVEVHILNSEVREGHYNIKLFTGINKDNVFGISLRDLEAMGLTAWGDDGILYAAKANYYIDLFNEDGTPLSLANAYIVLDKNGVLSLTTDVVRTLYWEAYSGSEWSYAGNIFFAADPFGESRYYFAEGDTVVFHDAVGTPHIINVTDSVKPGAMNVTNGSYLFNDPQQEGVTSEVVLDGQLKLVNAQVEFTTKLTTSADDTMLVLDDKSSLIVNNDLPIHFLQNAGTVTVNGDMSVTRGTSNGGKVIVNGDLTLGGNSTFSQLDVEGAVKGNTGKILTLNGDSRMNTIDGGTVSLGKNVMATVTTTDATTLSAVKGSGVLVTGGDLTLQGDSQTSGIVTKNLTLGAKLNATGTLQADSVTLDYLPYQIKEVVFTANNLDVDKLSVTQNAIDPLYLLNEGVYAVASFDALAPGMECQKDLHNSRYNFTFTVDEQQGKVLMSAKLIDPDYFRNRLTSENGKTSGGMVDSFFKKSVVNTVDPASELGAVITSLSQMTKEGDNTGADRLAASAGGASVAGLGLAFTDDVKRQLGAIRNRTTTMGVNPDELRDNLPAFNAWISGEGNYRDLSSDGTAVGYKMNSWGGTVGFDVDLSGSLTVGMAVSALYGDYSCSDLDHVTGDLDTCYATFFARYARSAWSHTFVATVGRADVSLSRVVSHRNGAYKVEGETDGTAMGAMYEVGRIFALNEEGSIGIQPVFNLSYAHTALSGYNENGGNAALKVGDMDMTTITFGLGARLQAIMGSTVFNREAIVEGRVLAKYAAGDTECEAENLFLTGGKPGKFKSADQGNLGLEIGAGVSVPVGGEGSWVFADFSAEVSSGYSSFNATLGYRVNF